MSREAISERKEDLSEDQNDVFVEIVAYEPADAPIAPSSMHKQESVQVEELTKGVIGGADSLGAFLASHTNTNMRLHNHRDIIGSITNR